MLDPGVRTFHIELCLGRGGFGEVYRARMEREGFSVDVALKLLRDDVAPGSQAAQRLRDEARMLGLVRHRAIPKIYDFVELHGRLALVSEYVEGADLRTCLKAEPSISARASLQVLADVADALHAAWTTPLRDRPGTLKLVHRDLKPANIRIGSDGVPKLLDFGIAWTEAISRVAHTQTAALIGSPAYMAPERYDGAEPAPPSDVFSLGAVLFDAVAGRRMFGGLDLRTLAGIALVPERFERALAERMAWLPEGLPPEVLQLLRDTVAYRPEDRPVGRELVARLQDAAATLPGPDLLTWSRQHDWPEPSHFPSDWLGRTLIEGRETVADTQFGAQTWGEVRGQDTRPLSAGPLAAHNRPEVESGPQSIEVTALTMNSVLTRSPADVSIDVSPPPSMLPSTTRRPEWARAITGSFALASVLAGGAWYLQTWMAPPTARDLLPEATPAVPVSMEAPPQSEIPAGQSEIPAGPEPTEAPDIAPGPPATATPVVSPRRPSPKVAATPRGDRVPEEPTSDEVRTLVPRIGTVAAAVPKPTAPAPATVTEASGNPVEGVVLVGNGRTFNLPAQIAPGQYEILANYGGGPVPVGAVELKPGSRVEIACSRNRFCKPRVR